MQGLTRIRQRLDETERKEQIVDAAIVVARRDGLEKMTARTVASEAGTSHGLVLHHFGSMQRLQAAMLRVVLARTLVLRTENLENLPADERILVFIRQQIEHFTQQSELIGLLLDYRILSARDDAIKVRIQEALIAFRERMEPFFASTIALDPDRFPGVSPFDMARVTAHFFLGFAVQRNIVPAHSDAHATIRTLSAILVPHHD